MVFCKRIPLKLVAWHYFYSMNGMKSILLFFALTIAFTSNAQTFVHGDEDFWSDTPLMTIHNGHILEGDNRMWNDAIYTVSNNKIYEGFSTSVFDIKYNYQNGVLCEGESYSTFDVVYTVKNGKIFKGDSTFPMDCVYTFYDNQLFRGDSKLIFDRVLWFDGNAPSTIEVLALIIAMLPE